MRQFIKEFREFALKGNVLNLAVGVIIGAAFQGMVTSLTNDILSPLIGLLTGQNFDALTLNLFGVTIRYGAFITSILNFFIMALVIFLLVKGMNRLMRLGKTKEAAPTPRTCPYCKSAVHADATRCPACTSDIQKA